MVFEILLIIEFLIICILLFIVRKYYKKSKVLENGISETIEDLTSSKKKLEEIIFERNVQITNLQDALEKALKTKQEAKEKTERVKEIKRTIKENEQPDESKIRKNKKKSKKIGGQRKRIQELQDEIIGLKNKILRLEGRPDEIKKIEDRNRNRNR